ncbi:MAG: SDR family oxidoreductase [Planctomycetota bacterium]|jgi:3-oxoacyl-[acyl-carrier protein] reductase|nr:SDR family oxidoreductase [Planctomycetota bacterium]
MGLDNRVALVTGAAKGIGFAIAERLARDGARVTLADVNAELAGISAEKLVKGGFEAYGVGADVSRLPEVKDMIGRTVDRFGQLDIVVNNAGILRSTRLEEIAPEEWDLVLAVNLRSVFLVSQQAIPHLKKSAAPRIINMSSNSGRMGGFESSVSYAASKGGVIALTYALAGQLAKFKITVNAICPGTTDTDILKDYTPEARERLRQRIPLGRLGVPADIAAAASYLAASESGFVTGLMLDINGGMYFG